MMQNILAVWVFTVQAAAQNLKSSITSFDAMEAAAEVLLAQGLCSVLLTGLQVKAHGFSYAYWTDGSSHFWLTHPVHNPCAQDIYEGVIARCLAQAYALQDAIVIASMHVNRDARLLAPSACWPESQRDLPYLSSHPLLAAPQPFKPCTLGLYPVVDSSAWVETLLPQGVKCIQLRIKDTPVEKVASEIKRSLACARHYGATLFVNDAWELAIALGADGVHLGQEDLLSADIAAIHRAGLCLGVSTHCYEEVARAHALNPSYIACGPIYSTTSKVMPFQPQGLDQLRRWRRTLTYPLVAIGGIDVERAPGVWKTGVEGVALISAITKAADPIETTQRLLYAQL